MYQLSMGFGGRYLATAVTSVLQLAATVMLLSRDICALSWLRPPEWRWTRQVARLSGAEAG